MNQRRSETPKAADDSQSSDLRNRSQTNRSKLSETPNLDLDVSESCGMLVRYGPLAGTVFVTERSRQPKTL